MFNILFEGVRKSSKCRIFMVKKRPLSFFLFLLLLPLRLLASPASDEARRVIALVDYVGVDYKNAVKDGKIAVPEEYQEMNEFSERALQLFDELQTKAGASKSEIAANLRKLKALIAAKENPETVRSQAQAIHDQLIREFNITPFPRSLPSFNAAQQIFQQNCATCHGESGRGDGPSRAQMKPPDPPPANFTDPKVVEPLSPFNVFNIASFGIEKTAMPDFSALIEEERWQVSFYIFSLRFSDAMATEGRKIFETQAFPNELKKIETLATVSDEDLLQKIQAKIKDRSQAELVLAYLRRGALQNSAADPLLIARNSLRGSMELYEKGDKEKAYQRAVEAYIDGFELVEPALFASDASFGRELEAKMTRFRNALKAGEPLGEVQKLYREIDQGLERSSILLSSAGSVGGFYLFFNALMIIVREGLEAALIVAAILALLRTLNARAAVPYIHLGWLLAIVAGLGTWFIAQTAISLGGSQREAVEGFTTLVAAGVLFYVSYWLISKMEARKWQTFIHEKLKEALSGKRLLALVGVSFFAVYREAFETVLFYQALWGQSSGAESMVVWGFLAGLLVLACLVFAIFRLGLKIPLKPFFGLTGGLLYLLAFVFVGQGIKELQAAGWVSVTLLPFPPQVSILGIYPTLETVLLQSMMIIALLFALLWLWIGSKPAYSRTVQGPSGRS